MIQLLTRKQISYIATHFTHVTAVEVQNIVLRLAETEGVDRFEIALTDCISDNIAKVYSKLSDASKEMVSIYIQPIMIEYDMTTPQAYDILDYTDYDNEVDSIAYDEYLNNEFNILTTTNAEGFVIPQPMIRIQREP